MQKNTRDFLKRLANSPEFIKATRGSISTTRMADKELVLRFIAFYLLDNALFYGRNEYRGGMDALLDDTISFLNNAQSDLFKRIESEFIKSMRNAYKLFGDYAFRKANYINKALFLSFSRALYNVDIKNNINVNSENANKIVMNHIENNSEYKKSISMATNDAINILTAHTEAKNIISECLK